MSSGAACAGAALLDRASASRLSPNNPTSSPITVEAAMRTLEINGRPARVMGLHQPNGEHGLSIDVQPFNVTLNNGLKVPTAIHWHGLHPPNNQDGVPGLTQPVIAPGSSYGYDFPTRPSGTHWMHSHEGLQEAFLLAAPLIVHDPSDEPKDERQIILFLGDFSFTPPPEIYAKLHKSADAQMPSFKMGAFAIACCIASLATSPSPAQAPQPASTQPASTQQATEQTKFNCQHAANPHRRQHDCNSQLFGWDETLAGDWNEVRRLLRHIGITPTASYVGALQTNVTGGDDQVWSYAGQLSIGFSANFQELLQIPGLSAYVGISWGTGSNLSGSLGSVIPTSGLYAPSFYLGEMYLQEALLKKKLNIQAGRIAASNSFATLPVFANYVNYGINPNPFSIGANDITFLSPPTGSELGAQATYAVKPSIQVAAGAFNTNINSANGENHGATSLSRKATRVSSQSANLTIFAIRQPPQKVSRDSSLSAFFTAIIRFLLSPIHPPTATDTVALT